MEAIRVTYEGNTFINAALISSLGVWTLDIFMNFFTGYVRSDGEVEMSLSKIAVKYLRTWFTADCAALNSISPRTLMRGIFSRGTSSQISYCFC
eukprot:4149636-Amphidinium_carterae.1